MSDVETNDPAQLSDAQLRLENQLCFAAYSAANAFGRLYKTLLDEHGLTYPQYIVMLVLWEREGVMVKDVARALHLDSASVTPILKRLEAAGYVKRSRDAEDERSVRLTLTDEGRALRIAASAMGSDLLCAVGLPMEEVASLREQLKSLRNSISDFETRLPKR